MTIENLKQIAIKYATTKGSRVPLAPDELCNAVVQYFNEFLKITADINTIQVAVTEEGGNIVFTITGNTLDGKAFTPIVITVDHNDFVTDQEFEVFKTNILDTIESLNNSIAEINSTLNNKLDKISSVSNSNQVYGKSAAGENLMYNLESHPNAGYVLQYDSDGNIYVNKGSSEYTPANMQNISDVEAKIPSTDNFLLKNDVNIINYSKFKIIDEIGSNIIGKADSGDNMSIGSGNYAMQLNSSIRPIICTCTPAATYEVAYISDIPAYKNVYSVSYDSTNGAIIAYDGANEIHIPLLAGENVTIDASEDNKKIVISAAGGGGSGDVTAAGNNIFTGENEFRNYTYDTSYFCFVDTKEDYLTNGYTTTIKNGGFDISYYENGKGKYWTTYADNQIINKNIDMEGEVVIKFPKKEGTFALTSDIPDTSSFVTLAGDNTFGGTNTFNNSIYAKNGVVAGDTTNYGANSVTKGSNTYSFPNKSGTFALTSDIPDTSSFVTLAGDNTFGGTNTFNNSIYAKNGVVAGDTTNYGANSVTKGSNTYSFPNKSGTFAMTTDVIKNPIYFISFYANNPSEPCHLIGTMMSKNSYGTGQKTNDEFAVMLADNLYTNSNEGLAAYGKLAEKDILCIYSEDGLAIRCLDEANSEVDLPTVMFFVMETEL